MKKVYSIILMFLFGCSLNAQVSKVKDKSDDNTGFKWKEVFNGQGWGVQSANGQEIIPCEYSNIFYSKGYFSVKNKNKVFELYDMNGKKIISLDSGYTNISTYNADSGYFEVNRGKSAGLTDLTGKEIISTERGYTGVYTYDAKKGFLRVAKDKSVGLTDLTGKEIISPDRGYTYIGINKEEGYFEVSRGDYRGLTDLTGKEIISPNRGYTRISTYETKDGYFEVGRDKLVGLSDLTGKEIISPDRGYTYIGIYKEEGHLLVFRGDFKGLADLKGKEIISPDRGYTMISSDLYALKLGYIVVVKDGRGVVTTDGKEIIAPVYGFDYISFTYNGYIVASKPNENKDMPHVCALFSKDGQLLIPTSKGYGDFTISGGTVEARKSDGSPSGDKFFISDLKRGISNSYDQIYSVSELNCKIGTKGNYKCLLDKDNNELIPLSAHLTEIYPDINSTKDKLFVEDENGNKGIITSDLKWIIPLGRKYTTLIQLGGAGNAPYYLVGSGDYRGVCDMAGRQIMDVAYDIAGIDNNGLAYGIKNDSTYFAYNYVDARGYYDKRKSEAAKANMQKQPETKVASNRFYIPILLNVLAAASAAQSYGSVSSTTRGNGFGGSTAGRQPKQCGLCGGVGKTIENDVVTFGSNRKKWCDDCQRYVSLSHRHATCISCKGKGYW